MYHFDPILFLSQDAVPQKVARSTMLRIWPLLGK
jgi:hypothetical protein